MFGLVSVCALPRGPQDSFLAEQPVACGLGPFGYALSHACLLYTSDAADEAYDV